MTVAGLQGGSAKHATGVPGQGTYEDLLRRGACAVPAPDAAAARHAERPRRSPAAPADDETVPPVPHQMARAQPQHPGPEIGHRAQEQEPGVVGHQMSRSYLWRSVPRVTRHEPYHSVHLRRRPKVMMRPHHSTEPRLLLGQHRTERRVRPRSDAAPVQETCVHPKEDPPGAGTSLPVPDAHKNFDTRNRPRHNRTLTFPSTTRRSGADESHEFRGRVAGLAN